VVGSSTCKTILMLRSEAQCTSQPPTHIILFRYYKDGVQQKVLAPSHAFGHFEVNAAVTGRNVADRKLPRAFGAFAAAHIHFLRFTGTDEMTD
jgi:hypothetical protein